MGVSSGDTDLNLLVTGGQGFADRITELRTATEAYTKALNDLNLGKEALAARDEAARVLTDAKNQRRETLSALEKEVTDARDNLSRWEEEIKAKNMAAYNEAQQALADVKALQEAAEAAHKAAQKALSDAKEQADSIVKDAESAAAGIIDRAKKVATNIVADARDIEDKARKTLADAADSKAKYDLAIDRIKGAMV